MHLTLALRGAAGGKPASSQQRHTASTRVAAALRMGIVIASQHDGAGCVLPKLSRRIGADVSVFATKRKQAADAA